MAKFRFNKITIKYFLAIAVPLAMQNLVTTAVNLADNVMVGKLGDGAIASVNQANQFFFVYSLIVFGICSGFSVFAAQYWGKRDYKNIRRMAGLGTMIAFSAGMIFAILGVTIPHSIMRLLSTDPQVIEAGVDYLKILSPSYPLTAVAFTGAYLLKSVENVKLPLFASIVSIAVNIFLNWVWIYGNLGSPALGIKGAAYATLIARVVEFIVIIIGIFTTVDFLRQGISDYIKIPKETIKKFISISSPVVVNESVWGLGTSLYTVFFARTGATPEDGTAALAAVHITLLAEKLASVFIFGLGYATSIIVGKEIGSRRSRRAEFSSYQISWLAPITGIGFSVLLLAAMPFFLKMFSISSEVSQMAKTMIIVLCITLPIKSFTLVSLVGTMRGGGDTRFACVLDVGGVWLISLPLIALSTLVLKLPIEYVYTISLIEEVVKAIIIIPRLKSRKWLHDLVNN